MKRILFLLGCACGLSVAHGQMSIYDCLAYPWVTQGDIDASYEFYRPCITLGNGESYLFQNTSNHKVTANTTINILPDDGFHAGEFSSGGQMWLNIKPKADFDVAVMNYPNLMGAVRYEKLELGVELPPDINTKVNNFIDSINPAQQLNPFMEWDLKVQATFVDPNGVEKIVDGFYYVEMSRFPTGNNWKYQITPYPFRIRFSPPVEGDWTCQVKIYENGTLTHTGDVFPFTVIDNGSPGFVSVSWNKMNLQRDGEIVYPVGQAIPWPTGVWAAPQGLDAWLNYHNTLNTYLDAGNSYVRMLLHPESNDIEFEKLGNYYDRLDYAWEMDKVFETLEEKDALAHFTLMMHNLYMNVSEGDTRWDFSNISKFPPYTDQYESCYKTELGLTEATQVLTDLDALKYLKQRMRYILSRYGYSTSISVMDLGSEMFHAGETAQFDSGYEIPCSRLVPYVESEDDYARAAVYNYHLVMSDYIKNQLKYTEHPIGVIYTMAWEDPNPDDCGVQPKAYFPYYPWSAGKGYPDYTFQLPGIDVICLNQYGSVPNKLIHSKSNNDWYSPNENSYSAIIHDLHTNFRKPVVMTEVGSGWNDTTNYDHCDGNTQYFTDIMTIPFTSAAGMYNWHQGINTDMQSRWDEVGSAADFINGPFAKIVLNSTWKQYREHSESSGSGNDLKEHQMYVSWDQTRAVGYIRNRTVNSKTMTLDPGCAVLTGGIFNEAKRHLYWDDDKHHFRGLKTNTNYMVRWYDYLTGNEITAAAQCIKTPLFSFDYEPIKHPDLYAWTETGKPFRPILWFTVEQVNCSKSLAAENTGDAAGEEIQANTGTFDIIAYPNPTTGEVWIEAEEAVRSIEVVNSLGIVVATHTFGDGNRVVNIRLDSVRPGVYYLRINHDARLIKIVKV